MAVIGFSYAMYLSTQVRLVPYIIEVDKLGTAVLAGFPEQIEYADVRVVRATLGNFVTNFRSITPDAVVQKQYIDRTYALLRTSESVDREGQRLVSGAVLPSRRRRLRQLPIEVNNIVALSNQTYQIDWTEYERDRKGKEIGTRRFRGIATVTLTAPQDEATIRLNPIGLYISDFDWTAQL